MSTSPMAAIAALLTLLLLVAACGEMAEDTAEGEQVESSGQVPDEERSPPAQQ